jgi:CPA1 family monovalent cation:H+ antiporter
VNVWTVLSFIFNGFVFLLIGLQLPSITQQLGNITLGRAIEYGLLISLVLIVARLLCAFGAALFTRFASRFITVADANPGWKPPIILGWAGMRGVVSLAAALSIPLLTPQGQPFPYRDLILFVTFVVILVTLVFQGLTLPWLIRKLDLDDKYTTIPEERQELLIQKKLAQLALRYLEENQGPDTAQNDYLRNLRMRLQLDERFLVQQLEEGGHTREEALQHFQHSYLGLLNQQRDLLHEMNQRADFDEEVIRKYLALLDLEEYKLREKLPQEIAL